MTPGSVGLFAKPAQAGRVKTRLVPPLTFEDAARLYLAFLADTALAVGGGDPPPAWEWHVFSTDPELQRATWPREAPLPAGWHAQVGDDLGARMLAAFVTLHAAGAGACLLVGSDHPTLPRRLLEDAFQALERADVVLGPSLDGGYYVIGLREPVPDLFRDIPWSTPAVLVRTLERAAGLGLGAALLPPGYDVDRPEDLVVLRRHLAALALAGDPAGARTRDALHSLPGAAL